MSKLKPCPFCGGKAELIQDDDGWFYTYVDHHVRCFLHVEDTKRWFETEEEAAEAWNIREYMLVHDGNEDT